MFRNLALQRPLAILDLETTGIDLKNDRIVEISVLTVRPNGSSEQHTERLNPGIPIPTEVAAIHGITDADVAGAPRFAERADFLLGLLEGCDLCGYNIKRFDLPLLHQEFLRAGRTLSLEGRAILDPQEIFHTREPRDLSAAVKFYTGAVHDTKHEAAGDVLATAAVLDAMLERYKDLPRDVPGLFAAFKTPGTLDSGGFFAKVLGEVRFVKGKYRGEPLASVALRKPDYLEWMLREIVFPDTQALVREALRQAGWPVGGQKPPPLAGQPTPA
jgi:DNA polymerase-3 subunit epsilon